MQCSCGEALSIIFPLNTCPESSSDLHSCHLVLALHNSSVSYSPFLPFLSFSSYPSSSPPLLFLSFSFFPFRSFLIFPFLYCLSPFVQVSQSLESDGCIPDEVTYELGIVFVPPNIFNHIYLDTPLTPLSKHQPTHHVNTHPITTSIQCTLSIYPLNITHPLSTYPISPPLST